MGQGLPGSQFPGEDALIRRVKDLERQMQQVMAANQLATAGIRAIPGGIVVDGSETVNGPMVINGPAKITGTLDLPAGIINNTALSNPSRFGQVSVNTTNFSLATTAAAVATGTIAVPDGYSQANVTVTVTVGAVNMTATGDFLYCQASINGVAANEIFSYASGNQGSAWTGSTKTATLTGLTGGVITLSALGRSQNAAWSANTANRAFVEAVVTFLR